MNCTACGRLPTVSYSVSLRGEVTCADHISSGQCTGCGRARVAAEAGWLELASAMFRCPACGNDAVNTRDDVRRVLPDIRRTARELGFALRNPVRVVLAEGEWLRDRANATGARSPLGLTEITVSGAQLTGTTVIHVLCGLPHDMFGSTVSHELCHAWMAENDIRPVLELVEEGLCELLAYAWLKKAATPFAEELRSQMHTNPDPVYGAGFRLVHESVRVHGLSATLAGLACNGELPEEVKP